MSDTPPNPLESLLTEFALGPSWARAKSEQPAKHARESSERELPVRRRDDRGENRGRREGGDRRDNRDGRGQRDGGGRRDFQKGRDRGRDVRREEFVPPAEGVTVSIVPDKAAIQLICKEIHQVARVYPLFDIAEIILAERSRCRAVFEIAEPHGPFLACKLDEALFLTKEEALRHLLESPWKGRYIEESSVEAEPPKGNFQSVARCGISGKLLGPPNYHGYQTELRRVHRERFPEMTFEAYAAKVRTDRSEEAVSAWLESMKTQIRWRILSDEESAAAEIAETKVPAAPVAPALPSPPAAPEAPAEEPEPVNDTQDSVSEPADEEPAATDDAQDGIDASAAEAAEQEASPAASEPDHKWFSDRAEFERAVISEVLPKTFRTVRKAKVSAAIPGRNLSPGLLARLKSTGSHHRKHPAIIIPDVCKILESEHMPVFKRKGKLYTGPARPNALPPDAVLAERPGQMVKWIRENTPAKLEGLWQAMLPEGATAPPQGYAADLFWLLQQGHILLYTDDTLVVQDPPPPQQPKKPKQPKKKAEPAPAKETGDGQPAPEAVDPTTAAEPVPPAEPESEPSEASAPPAETEPTLEAPENEPLP